MDPLSVAASVMGVLSRSLQLSQILHEQINSIRSPPKELRALANDVQHFASAMQALAGILEENSEPLKAHVREQLLNILSEASSLFSDLSDLIDQERRGISKSVLFTKLSPARIKTMTNRLDRLKSTLILFIQVIQYGTLARRVASGPGDEDRLFAPHELSPEASPGASISIELDSRGKNISTEVYVKSLKFREQNFFKRLVFGSGKAYGTSIDAARSLLPVVKELSNVNELRNWLESNTSKPKSPDMNKLRIILCDASEEVGGMPLSQQLLILLMDELQLPSSFFETLCSGTSKFVRHSIMKDEAVAGFVFRTPLANSGNWTLALSWNKVHGTLSGLVVGLKEDERSILLRNLEDAPKDLCHPMMLPVILCEMLTDVNANNIRTKGHDLVNMEVRAALFDAYDPTSAPQIRQKILQRKVTRMTRTLNQIISQLAFNELQMLANKKLVERIREFLSEIDKESPADSSTENLAEAQEKADFKLSSRRLAERLTVLEAEHQCILLEHTCHSKIAQSQLQILYSLIAQLDNRDNLQMAEISTRIANTAKDDSYAMRTLALMSILFLPGTFISSFFSMSMFNWDAPKGTKVLSDRFWIYWIVTIPFTLLVLAIWTAWYKWHKQRENSTQADKTESPMLEFKVDDQPELATKQKSWLQSLRGTLKTVEKKDTVDREDEADIGVASKGGVSTAIEPERTSFELVQRVNTVIQGPRR